MLQRIYQLLAAPEKTWLLIKQEPADIPHLFKSYALPLLLLPVFSSLVRLIMMRGAFKLEMLVSGLVNYILLAAALLFAGWVISLIARYFASRSDLPAALKLVVYSMTPVWLCSLFQIVPRLRVLSLLGLYSAYLLFTALPIVLETPPEKQVGLAAAIIAFGLVVMMYLSVITGGVFYF